MVAQVAAAAAAAGNIIMVWLLMLLEQAGAPPVMATRLSALRRCTLDCNMATRPTEPMRQR